MNSKSRIRRASAVASIPMGLVVSFAAPRAEAGQESCNVHGITYSTFPELLIDCADNTFVLFGNPNSGSTYAPCGADLGAVKAMESLAIAAYLSGAPLLIGYSDITCAGQIFHVLVNTDL